MLRNKRFVQAKANMQKEKPATTSRKLLPYEFDKWSTSLAGVHTSEVSCTQHTIKYHVPWALHATWSV